MRYVVSRSGKQEGINVVFLILKKNKIKPYRPRTAPLRECILGMKERTA
jgi:hypothetical protein